MKNAVSEQTALHKVISVTLRSGISLAGATGLIGGLFYMLHHGTERVSFSTFVGTSSLFASPSKLLPALMSGDEAVRSLSVIQIGILILLLTPVTRVALSIVGFALERDRLYVAITSVVLLTLMTSIVFL